MANADLPVNVPVSQLFSTVLSPISKVFKPTVISNFNPPACFLYFISPLQHKNGNHFIVTLSQLTQPWSHWFFHLLVAFFHFLFITENLEIRLSCFVFNFVDHQHAQVQENPQGSKGDNEIALSIISFSLSF